MFIHQSIPIFSLNLTFDLEKKHKILIPGRCLNSSAHSGSQLPVVTNSEAGVQPTNWIIHWSSSIWNFSWMHLQLGESFIGQQLDH